MKRILSIVAIIIIISCSYIFYQNQQPPEADDVYISTKDWAESINVLSVEKVNGEWVTFFRDNNVKGHSIPSKMALFFSDSSGSITLLS